MNTYQEGSFQKISDMLEITSQRHGANGFSIGEEVLPLALALDECGPVTWALVMHAEAIAKQSGLGSHDQTNLLPFTCTVNEQTPFGNQAIMQPGHLPLSLALTFLDAALEHSIALGMQHYGYSASEWQKLDENQKVIPIEPYLANLQQTWLSDVHETGTPAERFVAWPRLLDTKQVNGQPEADQQSKVLNFPSMR